MVDSAAAQLTNSDTARWMTGLTLFFVGLFSVASVLFYYADWKADFSILNGVNSDSPKFNLEQIANPCGKIGAWIGEVLVGRSFGVVGIVIPIVLTLIGLRILRKEKLRLNRILLGAAMILIFGSLTFGLVLGRLEIFNTGLGGAFGVVVVQSMLNIIGGIGCGIVLVCGWIGTGVFINRNFINTVNSAGNVALDGGERIVDMVKTRVASAGASVGSSRDESAQPTQSDESVDDSTNPFADVLSDMEQEVVTPEPQAQPQLQPDPEPQPEVVSQPATPEPIVFDPPQAVDMEVERPEVSQSDVVTFDDVVRDINGVGAGEVAAATSVVVPMEQQPVEDESPFREVLEELAGEGDEPATINSAYSRLREEGLFEEVNMAGGEVEMEVTRTQVEEERNDDDGGIVLLDDGEEDRFVNQSVVSPRREEVAPLDENVIGVIGDDEESGVVVTVEANEAEVVAEEDIETSLYDPLRDLNNYQSPPVNLLEDYMSDIEVTDEEIYGNKSRIEETLKHFGIPIQRIKATVGPTITLYEIVQANGVKISKIQGLENDIAQSLKALGIRIIAPIPGRGTIGIEVPNRHKQVVSMYSSVRSMKFQESKAQLPIVIGRTIQNENYVFDLAKMPHLLVAGATGQGKSVGLNAIITSLLYRKHPAELKLVMIDPKMVEFTPYKNLEHHFMAKMESEEEVIITDPKKAVYTLNSLCEEMERRLKLLSQAAVRNIIEYNDKFKQRRLNPEKGHFFMPYIVVVVDEFADLIMMTREVEAPVMRLAQKARAVGIHLIIATQRPDVKVITGGIKANFPARIAFRVMQMIDSRTIIDQPGANQLIGRGDMLFSKDGELTRIQCALVETDEVTRVVDYIAKQQGYTEAYKLPDFIPEGGGDAEMGSESGAAVKYDVLFADIARNAVMGGGISTSAIQRNYEVGFNRAGRIMTQLERAGIVGRQEGAKPREILFHDSHSLEAKLQSLGVS
ncbi:MAG: DNA translocase FtsK 4TM domain-containing protein [Rikenellaceae bacterium]